MIATEPTYLERGCFRQQKAVGKIRFTSCASADLAPVFKRVGISLRFVDI